MVLFWSRGRQLPFSCIGNAAEFRRRTTLAELVKVPSVQLVIHPRPVLCRTRASSHVIPSHVSLGEKCMALKILDAGDATQAVRRLAEHALHEALRSRRDLRRAGAAASCVAVATRWLREREVLAPTHNLAARHRRIVGVERRIAAQHLKRNGTEAPPVALFVVPRLSKHLWRNVVWRANRAEGELPCRCPALAASTAALPARSMRGWSWQRRVLVRRLRAVSRAERCTP
mmetsp:Transcript_7813/g.20521  ORF Transcript_7813/g.20521 Transcript_7813/m.20521 type:complete len:230 (+) Transcript_7813:624-1313(+)